MNFRRRNFLSSLLFFSERRTLLTNLISRHLFLISSFHFSSQSTYCLETHAPVLKTSKNHSTCRITNASYPNTRLTWRLSNSVNLECCPENSEEGRFISNAMKSFRRRSGAIIMNTFDYIAFSTLLSGAVAGLCPAPIAAEESDPCF